MQLLTTPAPAPPLAAMTPTPVPKTVTHIGTPGVDVDDGAFAALIGGVVGSLLLALICVTAVLLWSVSRQKGSYVTNEEDEDDEEDEEDEDNEEDEEDNEEEDNGSEVALRSLKEPLKSREDE